MRKVGIRVSQVDLRRPPPHGESSAIYRHPPLGQETMMIKANDVSVTLCVLRYGVHVVADVE